MRTSSRARASTGTGRSAVSRRSSTSWVVAANWSADGRSSSIACRPSRTASTSSFGRLSLPSIFRASLMRASTCRICLRAASFQSPGATSRRASTMVRIPPMACSAARSNPRRALSHAVNNPSEGAFSAGSSSASRSRRRNDDGVGQIFMPEKSSRSRASSTFRRRLSMAQQVLATRSACSSSGSAPPASPSRSRVTSCRRNAATSVRAASRSETTDPSSVAINLSTDSSRPSILDCPHSSRNVARMWSGMGPRSCFRFTTGAGCVPPHRRAPMAPPSLSWSSDSFSPFSRSRSIASRGSLREHGHVSRSCPHPAGRCRGRPSRSPSPAGPTPGAASRWSPRSTRHPASPPLRLRLPRPVSRPRRDRRVSSSTGGRRGMCSASRAISAG